MKKTYKVYGHCTVVCSMRVEAKNEDDRCIFPDSDPIFDDCEEEP